MAINLDQETPQEYINLEPTIGSIPLTEPALSDRVFKATLALGEVTGKSQDQIYQDLSKGLEDPFRQEAATKLDFKNKLLGQQFVVNSANQNLVGPSVLDTIRRYNTTAKPDSVVEEEFSKQYTKAIQDLSDQEETFLDAAKYVIPEEVQKAMEAASLGISYREFAISLAQNVQEEIKNQSWPGFIFDRLKELVPGVAETQLRGLTDKTSFFKGLLGENLYQQSRELLRLPFEEYKVKLPQIVKKLKDEGIAGGNPGLALTFLMSVIGESTSDENVQNVGTLFDLSTVGPMAGRLTRSLAYRTGLVNQVRDLAKSTIKSTEGVVPSKATIAEAAGNIEKGAVERLSENLIKEMDGTADPVRRAVDSLTSAMRTDLEAAKANPGRLSIEIINKLEEAYGATIASLVDKILNVAKVERIPFLQAAPDVFKALVEDLKVNIKADLSNSIADIRNFRSDPITKAILYDTIIGRPKGGLWFNELTAKNYAKKYGFPEATVQRNGLGWEIVYTRSLDETNPIIREGMTKLAQSRPADGWAPQVLDWIRNPDETLSLEQRMNRKVATYAPSEFMKLMKENFKEIAKIKSSVPFSDKKRKWNEWLRMIEDTQRRPDPEKGDGIPGYFFKDPQQIEDFYQRTFGRMPDLQEISAYFAYKRNIEIDRVFRNIAEVKNRLSVGAESHRFSVIGKNGKKEFSDWFDGIIRKELPSGDDSILVLGSQIGQEKLVELADLKNFKRLTKLRELVKKGEKIVIELYAPEQRPLQGFSKVGTDKVRYVVTDNVQSKAVAWEQVPRRGGGHLEYDYDFYIKQAKIIPMIKNGLAFKHWYEGDTTAFGVMLRKEGHKFVEQLEQVRVLLKDGKMKEAKAVATNFPIEWKELRASFYPKKDPTGKIQPPRFSLTEPFQVVPKNKLIIDTSKDALESRYPKTFKDGTSQGSLARQRQVQYTGERDAYEVYGVKDVGSRHNPVFSLEPARLVDPISIMNRSLTRIINSTFLDDYKIFSIENWLQQYKNILKADNSELRSAPYYHFQQAGSETAFKPGADPGLVQKARAARFQIQQLVGVPSKTDTLLHSMAQNLADSIYGIAGPKAALTPMAILPYVKDPFTAMRSFVFHPLMGLFNIAQLFVQSMNYTTIYGIAGPVKAAQGSFGALMHIWTKVNRNPEILVDMDRRATKFGWRPGEWLEAHKVGESSGFFNVAGEYATRDIMKVSLAKSGLDKWVLDPGLTFFTMGEKNARYGAWYAAFKEFRDANPTGRITNLDRQQILERADTLNANMSRASNSKLHSGVFSLPTQFYTYQLRMLELMTGKRLTTMEKARLFGVNALMYGFPTALGLYGFPAGDYIRKYGLENNYVTGDNNIVDLIANGVPAMLIALITGSGSVKEGYMPNFGERFGIGGFDTIREALRSDQPFWRIIGGAAFSTMANIWEASDGFTAAMMSAIRDDDSAFPMTTADIADIAKEIASYRNAWRGLVGVNTGRWVSKKGLTLENDVSGIRSIMQALTGLQSQEVSDLNIMAWSLKDKKDLEAHALKKFTQEFRRGVEAQENNQVQARKFFTRAFAYLHVGGYPEEDFHKAIAIAAKDYESVVERMNWDFYMKNIPNAKKQDKEEAYRRFLQRQNSLKGQ